MHCLLSRFTNLFPNRKLLLRVLMEAQRKNKKGNGQKTVLGAVAGDPPRVDTCLLLFKISTGLFKTPLCLF